MPIRMTGINSGLDTDTIVQALVSSYSYKKDKYKKEQTKLSWTQDAWKALNTKVYSLYTGISNLRMSSAYNMKKTTSSNGSKAKVTASNTASNGTQKLNIIQVAQAASLTGKQLGNNVKGTTTLAELGYTSGDGSITMTDGENKQSAIKISNSTTINDVVKQLKDAGLNANFDETNRRFYVSAKNSGTKADFKLTGDGNGAIALSKLGLSTGITAGKDEHGNTILTEEGEAYKKYADLANGLDLTNQADVETLKNNLFNAKNEYTKALETKESAQKQINNLTSSFGYATSYANVEDFYANHQSIASNRTRFENVLAAYSESSTAVVTSTGVVYSESSGTDDKGNKVYANVDKDGKKTFISKDSDDNYYEVKEKITFDITAEDGTKTSYEISRTDDGKFSFMKDGKTYVSDKVDGEYKDKDDPSAEAITPSGLTYTYEKQSTSVTVEKVTDAYKAYNISDQQAEELKNDLNKVKSFESQAKTDVPRIDGVDGKSYTYSVENIINEVHGAYAGSEPALGSGTDAIHKLVQGYAETVGELTKIEETQETKLQENSILKNLPNTDATEWTNAVDNMINNIQAAVDVLNNPEQYNGGAVKMDGQDSIIMLNGVQYVNDSNNISINGITIEALAETGAGDENAISITTTTDSQGIYDKIKEFLTQYNNLVNEMSKLYNATSAKGYEPLTDDEKDAMSDKEIEKWESKIKDSLLRKDSTLNGIMMTMSNAMMKSFSINGKTFNLASFGIKTLGYFDSAANEKYAYHIDGDSEDTNSSGNADRLMEMINTEPDTVMEFMQKLTSNLYDELGKKMQRTSLSSSYTIYNDKQMTKQYDNYSSLIKQWEKKITEKEDYYYKKFTAMETALAKLNNTQSSLTGFFS